MTELLSVAVAGVESDITGHTTLARFLAGLAFLLVGMLLFLWHRLHAVPAEESDTCDELCHRFGCDCDQRRQATKDRLAHHPEDTYPEHTISL